MSSLYVLEPPTKGKVVLQTTYGPLDIELWPKEAPKAVRNFVQLCMEGYFDNTIFHRIIKSFMVQGGDPTGTGSGGESIYGGVFQDEFHSRLRFNHRGLVASANAGSPHSNGSQFFISLDRCDWLDRKNTIFGKVTGDSIYNLLLLGDVETEKDDRPLDPSPRIISVEVLWNPFDDIEPRVPPVTSSRCTETGTENGEPERKKPSKMLNLLSFGDEAEEEEEETRSVKHGIKSSHDVLDDPRLLKDGAVSGTPVSDDAKSRASHRLHIKQTLSLKRIDSHGDSEDDPSSCHTDDEGRFDAHMRQKIIGKRRVLNPPSSGHAPSSVAPSSAAVSASAVVAAVVADDDGNKEELGVEKLYLKKKGIGSEGRGDRMISADADLQLLNEGERTRQLEKQKKHRIEGRQDDVLGKLEAFKKKESDWRRAQLKFMPEEQRDAMSRSDDPNDYVISDPLLDKSKEKFNRLQANQKRRHREWAGRSLT